MGTTITAIPNATTLVNILTVEPDKQATLVDLLRENIENVVSELDGWISTSLIVANDRQRVIIYSQWRDPAAAAAMQSNAEMRAYFPRILALAAFDSIVGDVAFTRAA